MSVFVNELAPPHVHSEQGLCVRQCRRIMKDTLDIKMLNESLNSKFDLANFWIH